MINFTVGPVQAFDECKEIGFQNIPYFRTSDFSKIMLDNERLFLKFLNAPNGSKAIFLTSSGTGAMEAAIMNSLNQNDKILIINGGSFGQRFADICSLHSLNFTEINLEAGFDISEDIMSQYDGKGFTALLVNIHETSTGVLYNKKVIKSFCSKNNLFLIVDAISSFLCDDLDMSDLGADVVITGSQKALACPPGISLISLSKRAIERVNSQESQSIYFDFKSLLKNMERGQTPFTPAVGTLLQIHERLLKIEKKGGPSFEINRVKEFSDYFRKKISSFPFEIFSKSPSNAVTSLRLINGGDAYKIFEILESQYGIWICPNGGSLKHEVFRVGHIGNISFNEIDKLIFAFSDMKGRGLL